MRVCLIVALLSLGLTAGGKEPPSTGTWKVEHGRCSRADAGGEVSCQCDVHYTFSKADVACVLIDYCATGTACSPDAICEPVLGGVKCSCPQGFEGNGYYCRNKACDKGSCAKQATCKLPQPGSGGNRSCTCNSGYTGDGVKTCVLVETDPCVDGTAPCGPNAVCTRLTNTRSHCECNQGYADKSGAGCEPVNPCVDATTGEDIGHRLCGDPEQTRRACVNTAPGNYSCDCIAHYEELPGHPRASAYSCVPINYCRPPNDAADPLTNSPSKCHRQARCIPQVGGMACICNGPKWVGNGQECLSIDLCNPPRGSGLPSNGGCSADATCQCNRRTGVVACKCKDGFCGDGQKSSEGKGPSGGCIPHAQWEVEMKASMAKRTTVGTLHRWKKEWTESAPSCHVVDPVFAARSPNAEMSGGILGSDAESKEEHADAHEITAAAAGPAGATMSKGGRTASPAAKLAALKAAAQLKLQAEAKRRVKTVPIPAKKTKLSHFWSAPDVSGSAGQSPNENALSADASSPDDSHAVHQKRPTRDMEALVSLLK